MKKNVEVYNELIINKNLCIKQVNYGDFNVCSLRCVSTDITMTQSVCTQHFNPYPANVENMVSS